MICPPPLPPSPPQGRLSEDFDDHNQDLVQQLCHSHRNLISLEMETFHLLDLARCSRGGWVGVGVHVREGACVGIYACAGGWVGAECV